MKHDERIAFMVASRCFLRAAAHVHKDMHHSNASLHLNAITFIITSCFSEVTEPGTIPMKSWWCNKISELCFSSLAHCG